MQLQKKTRKQTKKHFDRLKLLQRQLSMTTKASQASKKQSKQSTIAVVVEGKKVEKAVMQAERQTRKPKRSL